MRKSLRLLACGVLAVGVSVATPACASTYSRVPTAGSARTEISSGSRTDNGFREGIKHGEHDARDRRDFRVDRDGDYRHADDGYRREYGDREFYRQSFRRGYEAGYRQGYQRWGRR